MEITDLMNTYRECSRNLWNVYFSRREDIGASLDAFEQIRELLFEALVVSELVRDGTKEGEENDLPILKVVPRPRSEILINRLSEPGGAGYWDQEKDLVVGPDDITLQFLDYFDFSQVPLKEFHYCLCKVLSFPTRIGYVGRQALIQASEVKVFCDL
jgi:hypothetical protein